jgi:hypothetical protein
MAEELGAVVVVPEPIAAMAWLEDEYEPIEDLGTEMGLGRLGEASAAGAPIWLQLGIAKPDYPAPAYLEGSLSVWSGVPTPVIDWRLAKPALDGLRLAAPSPESQSDEDPEVSLLRVLPHVWARGIFRARQDLQLPAEAFASPSALLFPTVGFRAPKAFEDESDPSVSQPTTAPEEAAQDSDDNGSIQIPPFTVIRTNVCSMDNWVVSLRLPDLTCSAHGLPTEVPDPSGVKILTIPRRFFPMRKPTGRDIAEAIAHHQAATARAVSEPLRNLLRAIEGEEEEEKETGEQTARQRLRSRIAPPSSADPRHQAEDNLVLIDQMTEIIYGLDRQLSRLLRRFGSYGFQSTDQPPGEQDIQGLIPREGALRNQFALDELRSLRDDCRLVREVIRAEADARERDERDRFEFVAAIVGSAILFPTLIAGIYGANVNLPGPKGEGFVPLIFFVFFAGLFGFWAVTTAWQVRWSPTRGRVAGDRLRLWALVFASTCFLLAVLSLLDPFGVVD